MKALIVINDPPYGTERVYNALRLASALGKAGHFTDVTVFLMADAVVSAKSGQKTPDGYYNVEKMLKRIVLGGGRVLLCGTCLDARGMDETQLLEGTRRGTMEELARETMQADRILVF